jgi:predicted nucleic acid-binding Zn ribbon protein
MEKTCSDECKEIINLPEEDQVILRRKSGLEKKAKRFFRSHLNKK